MTDDLVTRLRAFSRHGHDDHSVGDEAADEIELLRSHATDLNIEIERLRKERDDARREVCEPIARQVPDKATP